jgi:hypothetical protein
MVSRDMDYSKAVQGFVPDSIVVDQWPIVNYEHPGAGRFGKARLLRVCAPAPHLHSNTGRIAEFRSRSRLVRFALLAFSPFPHRAA